MPLLVALGIPLKTRLYSALKHCSSEVLVSSGEGLARKTYKLTLVKKFKSSRAIFFTSPQNPSRSNTALWLRKNCICLEINFKATLECLCNLTTLMTTSALSFLQPNKVLPLFLKYQYDSLIVDVWSNASNLHQFLDASIGEAEEELELDACIEK